MENNALYVPLQFWLNCTPGLALPMVALQLSESIKHDFWELRKYNNFTLKVGKSNDINDYLDINQLSIFLSKFMNKPKFNINDPSIL